MWEFLGQYWVEILLSLISIIVGWVVGYAFYRLQKKDVASAETERLKQAQKELVDIIESHIISKQNITDESIRHLLVASEREYQVNLKSVCTPISLLQDVALRLQKSRHLDTEQKGEYAVQIDESISAILEQHKEVPEEIQKPLELADALEKSIEDDDKQKSMELIFALKEKINTTPTLASTEIQESTERWQLLASLIAGSATVIATLAVLVDFAGIWKQVGVEIFAAMVATAIPFFVALLYRFYKRRRTNI